MMITDMRHGLNNLARFCLSPTRQKRLDKPRCFEKVAVADVNLEPRRSIIPLRGLTCSPRSSMKHMFVAVREDHEHTAKHSSLMRL
jgi:hypothetical protein